MYTVFIEFLVIKIDQGDQDCHYLTSLVLDRRRSWQVWNDMRRSAL